MRIVFSALLIWVALISIYTFILCALDKRAAQREDWRVPERRFFILALLGGAIGLGLGMLAFHHKTRHITFFIAVTAGMALWCVIIFVAAAKSLV